MYPKQAPPNLNQVAFSYIRQRKGFYFCIRLPQRLLHRTGRVSLRVKMQAFQAASSAVIYTWDSYHKQLAPSNGNGKGEFEGIRPNQKAKGWLFPSYPPPLLQQGLARKGIPPQYPWPRYLCHWDFVVWYNAVFWFSDKFMPKVYEPSLSSMVLKKQAYQARGCELEVYPTKW